MPTMARSGNAVGAGLFTLLLAWAGAPGAKAAPATPMGTAAPAPVPSPSPGTPTPPPSPAGPAAPHASAAVVETPTPTPVAPPPVIPAPTAAPGPIPTADVTEAASDHDTVVGHWGIEARRISPGPYPLALRPGRGCPSTATTSCNVELAVLGARYWMSRNLALNAGVALALGGCKEGERTLDSYVGGGPELGLTLLLGNWRHLAVGASPRLGVFFFKPGGPTTNVTTVVDLRMVLEGELHLGFVGVPALSVGIASGLGFQYESTPDASVWSIGIVGPSSAWGVLTNLFIRYYL